MSEEQTVLIPPKLNGERLDKALAALLDNLSRSQLQRLIGEGAVKLGEEPITNLKHKTREGEQYSLSIPEVKQSQLTPVKMKLDIVFEDEHLLVINKPAGLTVHPAASTGDEPTLVHGLLAHCADSLSGIGGEARPGIVHRLDKDTSGLMLVAKHDESHAHLSAQLEKRTLKRTYLALCWGVPNPLYETIETEIARSKSDRKKMAVVQSGGKFARTHYEAIKQFHAPLARDKRTLAPIASQILCELDTGRTHQIRVHMTHIGHPLIGDPVYGGNTNAKLARFGLDPELKQFFLDARQQMLHALGIRFIHPVSGEEHTYEIPPSAAMADMISRLQNLA